MKFPPIDHKLTGVVVPVFSLRSQKSCGTGEFLDLPELGLWCKKCGLEIIQILPVNDTGFQESPYSALSAYALHPIFIRLDEIEGSDLFSKEISNLKNELGHYKRLQFALILESKLNILKKIFYHSLPSIKSNKELFAWINENQWVKSYAVFSTIRKQNGLRSWKDWDLYKSPSTKDLGKLWDELYEDNLFHAWVQHNLEIQLTTASTKLGDLGISLKGDIPILMNEDSCDVWAERRFFNLELSAGAPPDMFSADGQNWGFPVYNWNNLAKDDYSWWRNRLRQAAKFYHAYRIDHVLGFFRIWNIPYKMVSGSLGYFNPSAYIEKSDLENIGFDEGRINWLSKPHIYGTELKNRLGDEEQLVRDLILDRIGDEDLYLFKEHFWSEKSIYQTELSDHAKSVLSEMIKNVTLIKTHNDKYCLSWAYRYTRGYESLNDWEKEQIENLSSKTGRESEKIWEQNAYKLLSFMKESTDMLVCAEDLGAVPDCVPSVLQKLGIFGLKVLRWAREWDRYGQPYTPVRQYHERTVCTPAVHDSTTLKQWWFEEKNKTALAKGLSLKSIAMEPGIKEIETFFSAYFKSSSAICMIQLQDFFALDSSVCDSDIHFERINTPGTVQDINWSYRMGILLEDLLDKRDLSETIARLVSIRKEVPISF